MVCLCINAYVYMHACACILVPDDYLVYLFNCMW